MMIKIPSTFARLVAYQFRLFSVHNYKKNFIEAQVTRHHGYFKVDEYSHYNNDGPALTEFINKQKGLFNKEREKWKQITDQYYNISASRTDARSTTIPEIYDNYKYYTKVAWKDGREYTTIYRQNVAQPQKQQLVLDIMKYKAINRHSKTVQLLKTSFSPSHRYIAFGVDLRNSQKTSFFIKDTKSAKDQLMRIKMGSDDQQVRLEDTYDLVFASESDIYCIKTQNFRPNRVFYQNLETGAHSQILFEKDPQFYLAMRLSKDKKYLIITSSSKLKSKNWMVDLNGKSKQSIKIWEDSNKVYIDHVQDHFIIWAQQNTSVIKYINDSEYYKKIKINPSLKDIPFKNMANQVLHQCKPQETVEDIDLIKGHVILYINHVSKPQLKIISYRSEQKKLKISSFEASLPYNYGSISPGVNQNYNTDSIIFNVSTPFVYDEIYQYFPHQNRFGLLQKYQYAGPYFPKEKYIVEHVNVPSTTLEHIPLTIIRPKRKVMSKMIIHFYGFYGISTKITYDNTTLAALEKGWIVAYAHVRGGQQKGKRWHLQAMGANRERTWKDLQECIGYLIRQEFTHPSLLFISTSSAGAIAAWNAMNRKPHLYKGAILRYPFLDVLNSLMDSSQPLSNTDYEQFGNPIQSKQAYKTITAISPYQNIYPKQYPVIYIAAGSNDYRTPINQIAKFASRFRDRALENSRTQPIGIKGLTIDISATASHLGQASTKDQNYKGCDMFGFMDYVITRASKDVSLE